LIAFAYIPPRIRNYAQVNRMANVRISLQCVSARASSVSAASRHALIFPTQGENNVSIQVCSERRGDVRHTRDHQSRPQGLGADSPRAGVKTVLLIHGAWTDGSSWSKHIPLLEANGLHVIAVQIPLTSFADDVAATQRAIVLEDGPLLLVGHSYPGAVITEAGNDPKVAGLAYVSAVAPSPGFCAIPSMNQNHVQVLVSVGGPGRNQMYQGGRHA
jgi:pimeloyl-ACP methyl ester carboxylesterase